MELHKHLHNNKVQALDFNLTHNRQQLKIMRLEYSKLNKQDLLLEHKIRALHSKQLRLELKIRHKILVLADLAEMPDLVVLEVLVLKLSSNKGNKLNKRHSKHNLSKPKQHLIRC